jgi:hypothetical protein
MSIFTEIENGLKKVWNIISSPKAKAAVAQAASLVSIAIPIVEEISTLINPASSTVADVAAAYNKYGVPVINNYEQNPTSLGNAALNLASELLKKKLPANQASVATNILNTSVQLAVTAIKNA